MIWNDQHDRYAEDQPVAPSERLLDLSDPDGALDIPVALGAALRLLVASWKEVEGAPTHNDQDRGIRAASAACAYQLERVLREWNLA